MEENGNMTTRPQRYGAIDGLRTLACIGIVMMHMAANNTYQINGVIYNTVIPSFTHFVVLFMVVSAFGMCCGYYRKIMDGTVSMQEFYSKRFRKIWPFFSLLVLLDIAISPSVSSLYEAFADMTLLFGLLPDGGSIEVIGVGWFLGVVFVFYLIFPFFCWLLENRRRAWAAFGISLVYNFACVTYFGTGRENILRSGCFFLAGGLIYLYRDSIAAFGEKAGRQWVLLMGAAVSVLLFFVLGDQIGSRNYGFDLLCLLVSVMFLIYAVSKRGGVLDNWFMHFFSGISMEIYLSHMVIFRVVEKLHLNTALGDGWLQYMATVAMVLCGTAVFAAAVQKMIKIIWRKAEKDKGYGKEQCQ